MCDSSDDPDSNNTVDTLDSRLKDTSLSNRESYTHPVTDRRSQREYTACSTTTQGTPSSQRLDPILNTLLLGTLDADSPLALLRGQRDIWKLIYEELCSYWRRWIARDSSASFSIQHGVPFPPPQDINVNMMPIVMGRLESIPETLRGYWPVLQACMARSSMAGEVGYLTVQESVVAAASPQRRGGLHTESPGVSRDPGLWRPGRPLAWGLGCGRDVLNGGIFMASTVAGSCEVWPDVKIRDPVQGGAAGPVEDSHSEEDWEDWEDWERQARAGVPAAATEAGTQGAGGSAVGQLGDVEHMRGLLEERSRAGPRRLQANELVWITDATPHESLPIASPSGAPVYRQFFRLVAGAVSVWYEDHSSYNPIPGVQPQAVILKGNKFQGYCRVDNRGGEEGVRGGGGQPGAGSEGGRGLQQPLLAPTRVKVVSGRHCGARGTVLRKAGRSFRVQLDAEGGAEGPVKWLEDKCIEYLHPAKTYDRYDANSCCPCPLT